MRHAIRSVDLFCGCGGLALGFETHTGVLSFETVLGVDNDPAALRVFNRNFSSPKRKIATGRLCDLFWFNHQAEIRLYYLVHFAIWAPDIKLLGELQSLGLLDFLAELRSVDEAFATRCEELSSSSDYIAEWSRVDQRVTQLALFRAVVNRLGLRSLRNPRPEAPLSPWCDEYALLSPPDVKISARPIPDIQNYAKQLWEEQFVKLSKGTSADPRSKTGPLATRIKGLLGFLGSKSGQRLAEAWITWRTIRDSIRAAFVTRAMGAIDLLYFEGPRAQLLLGGPPCKGWSRIGRAVIQNLRTLGLHAWACDELGDERNALLYKYVLFLDALKPDAFLFENVAHFESSLRTPSGLVNAASLLEEALQQVSGDESRFRVSSKIISSRKHGIPQDRERYIMIGLREGQQPAEDIDSVLDRIPAFNDEVPLKLALAGLGAPLVFDHTGDNDGVLIGRVAAYTLVDPGMSESHKTYLKWIRQPDPRSSAKPIYVDSHVVRKPRFDDARLYEYLAPGKRWMDYKFDQVPTVDQLRHVLESCRGQLMRDDGHKNALALQFDEILAKLDSSFVLRLLLEALAPSENAEKTHHLLRAGYLAKGTDHHGDWLERLSPERPCKTIVAHIGKDTYGYIHPTEPRALSLREAARVQSFPDYFSFADCGLVDAYSVVGNAVPPLLAAGFANALDEAHLRYGIFNTESTGIAQIRVADAV